MNIADNDQISEFDIRSIGALLGRQYLVILTTAVVIFGVALVFLMTVTPVYTATTLVLVEPDNQSVLNTNNSLPISSGRDNTRIDSEVEILKSDSVALAVVVEDVLANDAEFGLRKGAFGTLAALVGLEKSTADDEHTITAKTLYRFKDATHIRRKGLTLLITVSADSKSPLRAAELANKLSAAYISQQVRAKISRSLAARDILKDQIKAAQFSLTSYEAAFDQIIEDNLGNLSEDTGSAPLLSIRAELLQTENRLNDMVKTQLEARQHLQQENWQAFGATLGNDQLGKLANRRSEMLRSVSQKSADRTQNEFHQALSALDDKLNAQSNAGLQSLSAQAQDIDQNIAALRSQMRRAVLSSELSPGMLTKIYTIQQETSIAQSQYENLLVRLRDLDTQAHIQIADSRIVSPALAPINATFPNRNLVLLASLAASIGIGSSLAFLKEYFVDGITSDVQLGRLLNCPTVGVIPSVAAQNSHQIKPFDLVTQAPLSVYPESIRKLRASIDQSFRATTGDVPTKNLSQGKIVLVTSTMADEGKTTVALSLARTYAQAGVKTLLIDADLRRPSIHSHLGFSPRVGFAEYLRNASEQKIAGSFYARDRSTGLAMIMGAAPSESPTDQLVNSATFDALLDQAKAVYDIIVIDSPPLLPVVDARYIARNADAVALVVKWATTSQIDLKSAAQSVRPSMKPGAAMLPVLAQTQSRKSRQYGKYADAYSAAI